jgi:hypothetical protein
MLVWVEEACNQEGSGESKRQRQSERREEREEFIFISLSPI